jgi:hypothetical protein
MLEGRFLEDAFLATLVGVLGALVTAIIAHAVAGPLNLGAMMLTAAIGTMAFFSIYVATIDHAAGRDARR